jgi:hypothetical protein
LLYPYSSRDDDARSSNRVRYGKFIPRRRHKDSSKMVYCDLCGKQLVYLKPAQTWYCWDCNHTPQWLIQLQEQESPPPESSVGGGGGGIPSIGGGNSSDKPQQRTRSKPFIKSAGDPRAKILKKQQQPEYDDETRVMVEAGYTLVAYEDHTEKSDNVLTPEELRAKEGKR